VGNIIDFEEGKDYLRRLSENAASGEDPIGPEDFGLLMGALADPDGKKVSEAVDALEVLSALTGIPLSDLIRRLFG
jgi:hypothetical protein